MNIFENTQVDGHAYCVALKNTIVNVLKMTPLPQIVIPSSTRTLK